MDEPAFPCRVEREAPLGGFVDHPGMTLRDWFAGQALASALVGATDLDTMTPNERKQIWGSVAGIMYELADAMLAERSK